VGQGGTLLCFAKLIKSRTWTVGLVVKM
jgi:hypothetical protein